MSTFTETLKHTFHIVTCYTCGVPFGIEDDLHRRVVRDAIGSVYCPACGKRTAWRESDAQKKIRRLQSELQTANNRADTAKRRADLAESQRMKAERSLSAQKGINTKMRKRVGKGVCPCCNRSFSNLERHMASKHPEFSQSE